MGYFANGSEGECFQASYCDKCIHDNADKGIYCPIWSLHLLHNYEECNKPDSYLHALITRDGAINRCTMFVDRGALSTLQLEKIDGERLEAIAEVSKIAVMGSERA